MCIIIANAPFNTLSKETIKNSWNNNDHGAGLMYVNEGEIVIKKELHSVQKFYKAYTKARKDCPESNIVLHFRISTHGKINTDNCHPFSVNEGLAFAHNGIISNAPRSADFSDTYMFNQTILKSMPDGFIRNNAIRELIHNYIGTGSKLVFLDKNNTVEIINEKAGHWDNGNWYSNYTYQKSMYRDFGGQKFYYPQNQIYLPFGGVETKEKKEVSRKVVPTMNIPKPKYAKTYNEGWNMLENNEWVKLNKNGDVISDTPVNSYSKQVENKCEFCGSEGAEWDGDNYAYSCKWCRIS